MSTLASIPSIGQPLPRVDGRLKVTGQARYTAEWEVPNLVHGAVVDSAIARGRVRDIDVSAALSARGVVAVMAHRIATRRDYGPCPKNSVIRDCLAKAA